MDFKINEINGTEYEYNAVYLQGIRLDNNLRYVAANSVVYFDGVNWIALDTDALGSTGYTGHIGVRGYAIFNIFGSIYLAIPINTDLILIRILLILREVVIIDLQQRIRGSISLIL